MFRSSTVVRIKTLIEKADPYSQKISQLLTILNQIESFTKNMGCSQSTPKVENRIKKKPTALVPNVNLNQAIEDQSVKELEYILRGVYSIKRLEKSHPVICYSDESFPIINEKLYDEDKDEIGVILPIIAGCTFGEGKILFFGNSGYASSFTLEYDDTQLFINNCINWLRLPKLGVTDSNVYILGFVEKTIITLKAYSKRKDFRSIRSYHSN